MKNTAGDKDKKKVFSNFFFLGLERITQLFVIIFINRLLINNYSFSDFSGWQYSLVIYAIFLTGTWVCGSEVVIPKLLDYPENIDKTLSNVILLRLLAGLVVGFGMFLWGIFAAEGIASHFIIGLAISVALREAMIIGLTWYQSQARLKSPCLILIFSSILKFFVVYIGVKNHVSIEYLWLAWVLESLLPCVIIFYFFKKNTGFKLVRINSDVFLYFKIGMAVWFCLCMQQVTMKFDRVFLGKRITGEAYSNYAAALQLVDNWYAICILFVQAIAPVFIFKYLELKRIKENLRFCIVATIIVASMGALISSIFADFIIRVFYGNKLVCAKDFLSAFIWLTPLLALDQLLSMVLIRTQQLKKLALKWLLAFLLVLVIVPSVYYYFSISYIFIGLAFIYIINIIFSVRCINNVR